MQTADAIKFFGSRYKLAMALGLTPATVYGSWGEEVPQKHWQRLEQLSGGKLRGAFYGAPEPVADTVEDTPQ